MANNRNKGNFTMIKSDFKNQDTINGTLFSMNAWEKQSYNPQTEEYYVDEEKGKYSLTLLVKKDSTSGRTVERLLNNLTSKVQDKKPNYKHIPMGGTALAKHSVKDGDDSAQFTNHRDEYKGNYILSLKNGSKPITLLGREGFKLGMNDNESLNNDFYNGVTVGINGWFYHMDSPLGVYGIIRSAIFRMDGNPITFGEEITASDFGEMSEEEIALFIADFQNYD